MVGGVWKEKGEEMARVEEVRLERVEVEEVGKETGYPYVQYLTGKVSTR